MLVTRREKETNQQVLRRFNRIAQLDPGLQTYREKLNFVKKPNRFIRLQSAVRREHLRKTRVWY